MPDYADLEIGLHRRDVTSYAVDLRFIHPDSDADVRLVRGANLPLARFDPDRLHPLSLDPAAYGQELTAQLCADPDVPAAFAQAFASAQSLDSDGKATLAGIITHLRDGYDILYLVAHGAIIKGDPFLWLEDEQGSAAVTPGSDPERGERRGAAQSG